MAWVALFVPWCSHHSRDWPWIKETRDCVSVPGGSGLTLGATGAPQGAGQFKQLCLHFGVFFCLHRSCHARPAGVLAACTMCTLGSKLILLLTKEFLVGEQ